MLDDDFQILLNVLSSIYEWHNNPKHNSNLEDNQGMNYHPYII